MEGISFVTDMLQIKLMLQFDIVTTALINHHQNSTNHLILCQNIANILKYASWDTSQPI